ncbi:MAG: dihydropteroate synthase [Bacteroidetes bacterium]|nr:MAG: dihydropteroate synthase [Bacteroidota bacterium]
MHKSSKDISFNAGQSINCNGKILDLLTPVVMGIVNLSPDSFYVPKLAGFQKKEGEDVKAILHYVGLTIEEGATIIDIGAYSSRPGAKEISTKEELKRLLPVLAAIRVAYPDIVISVDTFRSEVALEAGAHGADVVNDISGGEMDTKMFDVIANSKMAYILMHMKGTPQNMQDMPEYLDVYEEVFEYFSERLKRLEQLGVENIIIDPGFGFGKSLEHNYILLNKLAEFRQLGHPILAGLSRKSMINKVLGTSPENALNGTSVLNAIALLNGAKILRVHDVKEASEAIKLVNHLRAKQ